MTKIYAAIRKRKRTCPQYLGEGVSLPLPLSLSCRCIGLDLGLWDDGETGKGKTFARVQQDSRSRSVRNRVTIASPQTCVQRFYWSCGAQRSLQAYRAATSPPRAEHIGAVAQANSTETLKLCWNGKVHACCRSATLLYPCTVTCTVGGFRVLLRVCF